MATRRDGIANSPAVEIAGLTAVGRTTHRGWGVTPTRPRHLLAVGLVVAVLANLVVRLTYGSLPGFPLFGGITLAVLGVAEAIGGRALRARIRREPGTTPVQPLVAARAVLVAKASSVAGAVVGGAWLGCWSSPPRRPGSIQAAGADTAAAAVGLGCALVLVGGALWLEHCCRTPDDHRTPRPVGSGAMTQATGVLPDRRPHRGAAHAATPAPGRARSRHRAGRAGHLRAGRPGAGRHERGPGRHRGRGAVRAAARRPGRGRVPVDRPLGARTAAAAAHRVPVGRLLLRARRADHQLQRGAGRRRAARAGAAATSSAPP